VALVQVEVTEVEVTEVEVALVGWVALSARVA
jgi:hypothetical protein